MARPGSARYCSRSWSRVRRLLALGAVAGLVACGGGGDSAPPAANGTLGPAGGTVTAPGGAQAVVPAGALSNATPIAVTASSTGAPPLPAGVTAAGPMVAFTPHGTTFAIPVTVTVPFDPASVPPGRSPVLYKTNAAGAWELVQGATVTGSTLVARVSSFSWFQPAPPPDPLLQKVIDEYWYTVAPANKVWYDLPSVAEADGLVDDVYDPKPITLTPPQIPKQSGAEVHVAAFGIVYSTAAVAPIADLTNPNSPVAYVANLKQTQVFRKKAGGAAFLKLIVTKITNELMDDYPHGPTIRECRALASKANVSDDCSNILVATNTYKVTAFANKPPQVSLAHGEIHASLNGWINTWQHSSGEQDATSTLQYIARPDFAFDDDVDRKAGDHAKLQLNAPMIIEIPLDAVGDEEEFTVQVEMSSAAVNMRGGDAFAGAWFHDPQKFEGVTVEMQNVELVAALDANTLPVIPVPPQIPAPTCGAGPDPAAGSVQFASAQVRVAEASLTGALVYVTRTGGSKGEVSAMLSMRDGSARAGVDYRDASTLVRFADGEKGSRFVRVPIIPNEIEDGNRTVELALADVRGCATLGAQASSTLTIVDDDLPLPVATDFALGGTVTGLAGSGLVLRTDRGDEVRPVSNGPFTFPSRLTSGTAYTVSVAVQPVNPPQSCSISRGGGTIAAADVTDIAVDCVSLAASGSLDPAFGAGTGRVSTTSASVKAIALQPDGKLLAVGGLTLSRFNGDGSPDATFGSGGTVTIVANGGPADAMQAVAVQPDGRIVVAGQTSLPTAFNDDMVVLRLNADGTPDLTFGSGGKTVIDFAGLTDRAYAVLLQADGSIVAAGFATLGPLATADQDIAVVRLTSAGALDPGFGSGGKATVNAAGRSDFGYAAALQADGRIVVAGRVAASGGANPDFGLVRFLANGLVDTAFGSAGVARVDFGGAVWDEAGDVLVQPDGAIVVGGFTQNTGVYRYALARLTAAGQADGTFGVAGLVSTSFTGSGDFGRGIALQADGRIVVAGQLAASTANPDLGLARYTTGGTLDTGFGVAGVVRIDFFGAIDNANDVLIQPDGRIIAAGSVRNGLSTGLGVVRVMP